MRFVAPTLVLSIAAGKPIALFERVLARASSGPGHAEHAGCGEARDRACANKATGPAQRALAERLRCRRRGALGRRRDLMHAVTAVSGSGPAYVFHMIEAMAAAGVRAGLPGELAMRLARATVVGAGELAFQSEDTAALRTNHQPRRHDSRRARGAHGGSTVWNR